MGGAPLSCLGGLVGGAPAQHAVSSPGSPCRPCSLPASSFCSDRAIMSYGLTLCTRTTGMEQFGSLQC